MNRFELTILIFFLMLSTACKRGNTKNESAEAPPISVEVTRVTLKPLYDEISCATKIEDLYSATIQPRVSGFLRSINFEGGTPVRRGALLFEVDPSAYATTLLSARAAVEGARASQVLAQSNYERAVPLAAIDAISQSDLDQYRAAYKSAVATTKSAEESLHNAELEIGYTKIYAPISGIASKSTASVGDYIGIGTLESALTTISYVEQVSVEIAIPTARYFQYSTPQGGSYDNSNLLSNIVLQLADSSTYPLKGEYYYTLKDVPAAWSTVVIVAKFHNPDLLLKEGMFARVRANIGEPRNKTLVPKAAISQLQGINSVWVIQADSTAQWRRVKLGNLYGDLWAIDEGVEEGERVVTAGGAKLHNGAKVRAREVKKEV